MHSSLPLNWSPSKLKRWADRSPSKKGSLVNPLHTIIRLIFIILSEFRKNDLALRSGALTYTVLLSLVPILAMSTAVVKGLGGGDQLREVAYSYIDTLDQSSAMHFPWEEQAVQKEQTTRESSNITGHMRSAIDQLFAYVDKTNFATLGTFGVVGILLSVVLVLGNIEMAMNAIWHVQTSRSLTRKIADYLTLIVLMPITINVAFVASAFLKNPTLASKFQLLIPFVWVQTLILKLVPVFFIALTLYVIYIFFPNTKVRTLPAMIGSVLAAMLWFTVQNVYISLQVGVSNYNAIYGSFATLPLFLIWMYLGWLFILGGALVAYGCQHLATYRLTVSRSRPSRKLSAAFDLMALVQKNYESDEQLNPEEAQARLADYEPDLVDEIMEELQKAKILHISTTDEQLLPAGRISHTRIIEAILGTEVPDTPGGKSSLQALRGIASQQPPSSLEGDESGSGSRQEGESST